MQCGTVVETGAVDHGFDRPQRACARPLVGAIPTLRRPNEDSA